MTARARTGASTRDLAPVSAGARPQARVAQPTSVGERAERGRTPMRQDTAREYTAREYTVRGDTARALAAVLLIACGDPAAPSGPAPTPPAHVEHPVAEGELAVVHLTADAERRLALELGEVTEVELPSTRLVGGEVVAPPGMVITVTAPIAGMVRGAGTSLTPGTHVAAGDLLARLVPVAPVDRDVRARADREVSAARAQLDVAEVRVARLERLVAERAGSQRLLDEAIAARDVARADLAQAEARAATIRRAPLASDVSMPVRAPEDGVIRALSAADGQTLAAGAPILEIVAVDGLMVRVPVFSADRRRVDPTAAAQVETLGGADVLEASPALAPPTADAAAGTVDRYYTLPAGAALSLGERVLVRLPLREEARSLWVPRGAVVYDAEGGAWVYVAAGERAYRRTRIDVLRAAMDGVVFTAGPALGTRVVAVGAADLFGTEFPPGH